MSATKVAENLEASVRGVSATFPWEDDLRRISPIVEAVSHLRAFWYAARQRWVLYDCLPAALIQPKVNYGFITGAEFLKAAQGRPPRELPAWDQGPISDAQHEFFRLYRVFATPYWVLQGEGGGHPHKFSPWEQNILTASMLPTEPPEIGFMPPCPFDMRAIAQLERRNRLNQFGGSLKKLQDSGSAAYAESQVKDFEKQMRLAECDYIEQMLTPIIEQANHVARNHSENEHDIYRIAAPGSAAKADDAYEEYKETGEFRLLQVPAGR
jgi:hypothetical protein